MSLFRRDAYRPWLSVWWHLPAAEDFGDATVTRTRLARHRSVIGLSAGRHAAQL